MRCSSCGFENLEGMKFCGECGKPLSSPVPLSVPGSQLPSFTPRPFTVDAPRAAERRQLTVMFCDLVGSTSLSEKLDPEEFAEIIRTYQETCTAVVNHFGGEVAQYLGDGVLAHFGYPVAHEDSAQRAIRAGLAIVDRLRTQVFASLGSSPLQVRIGIHTGLVVVGEQVERQMYRQVALGETLNLAARLQEIAQANTVVVTAATLRLVQGFFTCQDLGTRTLKGLSTPVQVYQVLGESEIQSRLEVSRLTGLTPLIGREHETALLLQRWQQATAGRGQVVLLGGEAGIGKSRLMQMLKDHLAEEAPTVAELRCAAHHQNSAFYPIIDYLQRLLHFHGEEPHVQKQRLEKFLAQCDLTAELPFLATLLSLPTNSLSGPLLNSQRQKQRTQQALLEWFFAEARKRAALLIVEDLHWVDPSTLEFLTLLLEQVPTERALIVLTFRPSFTPPWSAASSLTTMSLQHLSHEQTEVMVTQVIREKSLPTEVVRQIVRKADGVPLFVEEITKSVIEAIGETGQLPSHTIPATLHDSLMARLDRLTTAKEVAQLGAMLGREFAYEVLRAVSPLGEEVLLSNLVRLVEAELLHQRGIPPQARYTFKHALIQEAAYQSLLKSTRQQLHRQIARTLAERFQEVAETQPEMIAHHYTEAGLIENAISWWQQAGQRAVARSAHVEAISHLTKGLALLKTLPQTPDRNQQELTLQLALGVPLTVTKGYAAPEVGAVYTRARDLSRQVGESAQLFPVLFGLWRFALQQAELQAAREFAEQSLRLAENLGDPVRLLRARNTLGVTLFYLGEFVSAQQHLDAGLALYDPSWSRSLTNVQDPVVACLAYASWNLWHLGYPDQAQQKSHEAVTRAQELAHPYSLAMSFFFAAELHYLRREVAAVHAQAMAAITLSKEQEFPFWFAQGTSLQGWAIAERGQPQQGIAQMRQGFSFYETTGSALGRPYWMILPTATQGQIGQTDEGLRTLAEAHAEMLKSGERYYEAEVYRLKGELALQQEKQKSPISNPQAEAESCFLKAIEISRQQQAKALELRATTSLARLWQHQGQSHAAHRALSTIYNWFTEGFATADLQEAKVLLDELQH